MSICSNSPLWPFLCPSFSKYDKSRCLEASGKNVPRSEQITSCSCQKQVTHLCASMQVHSHWIWKVDPEQNQTNLCGFKLNFTTISVFHYKIELSPVHQSYTEICLSISIVQFNNCMHVTVSIYSYFLECMLVDMTVMTVYLGQSLA